MNPQSMDKLVQEAKDYFQSFTTDNRIDEIEFDFLNDVVECVKENHETGEKFIVSFCPDDVLCIWAWYYTKEGRRQLKTSSDADSKELPSVYQELFQEIHKDLHIFHKKHKELIKTLWQNG